jgi:hypothetical protein
VLPSRPNSGKLPPMKYHTKNVFFWALILLLAASCGQDKADNPASGDSQLSMISADNEACILDSRTSLMWQGKTDVAGLHDYRNTYSWYDPNEANGELDYRGTENGGECAGSSCDTWYYVLAVNEAGYCGHSDWRMPGKDELFSISDVRLADNPPTVDTNYFALTNAAEYWSANDYSFQWDASWAWNFQFGHDRVDWKKSPKYVRLVRGNGENLPEVKE